MTKRQIWCCSGCRRKPLEQTTWLETWSPWSWYTDRQGQSWKRRERAEWPRPVTAPQGARAASVALPRHSEVGHFDHMWFPHQAVPSGLQEKKVQRQNVRAERLSQSFFLLLAEWIALKKMIIKVTSYHTKRVKTRDLHAFYTFYSHHVPVAKKAVQPSVWLAGPCCPEKAKTLKYPKLPTALAPLTKQQQWPVQIDWTPRT